MGAPPDDEYYELELEDPTDEYDHYVWFDVPRVDEFARFYLLAAATLSISTAPEAIEATPRTVPAAPEAIEALEKVNFPTGMEGCSICMEDFKDDGSQLIKLPCSHVYHAHCISEWFKTNHVCPLCRFPLPPSSL